MKRLADVRFIRRPKTTDAREPLILNFGDPVTVRLTRELEDRKRRLRGGEHIPAGL